MSCWHLTLGDTVSCSIIPEFIRGSRILAGIWELEKRKRKPTTPHLQYIFLICSLLRFQLEGSPCDFVLLIRMVGYLREADISKIQAHSMGTRYLGTPSTWRHRTRLESCFMWWGHMRLKITHLSDFFSSPFLYSGQAPELWLFNVWGSVQHTHNFDFLRFCLGCWFVLKLYCIVGRSL